MAVRATAPAMLSGTGPAIDLPVERLARWLLIAVALDLVLTRLIVRMAIFIPKGEPWATLSAGLGRVGAVADALVPIVGVLLLGALLARAGRTGDDGERLLAALVAVVAGTGFALIAFPPSEAVLIAMDGVVVVVAISAGLRVLRRRDAPVLGRAGLLALAGSVALAGIARILAFPAAAMAGELAFLSGGLLAGFAGFRAAGWRAADRGWLVAGALVAVMLLVGGVRAPVALGSLEIWSLGLTGVLPVAAVALMLGMATAGLPRLARRDARLAMGSAIVLLSGFGLAASGLLLAALLGLLLGSGRLGSGRIIRPAPPPG